MAEIEVGQPAYVEGVSGAWSVIDTGPVITLRADGGGLIAARPVGGGYRTVGTGLWVTFTPPVKPYRKPQLDDDAKIEGSFSVWRVRLLEHLHGDRYWVGLGDGEHRTVMAIRHPDMIYRTRPGNLRVTFSEPTETGGET